jgi:hypothetical protein
LLTGYWPLVRRLARALVQQKVVSGRRARRILFRAMQKDLRRSRTVAGRDRRDQQAWGGEFRRTLAQVA